MNEKMRLDRFLAEMQKGTRSQVKEMIRNGRVTVDGTVCRDCDLKLNPGEAAVALDGETVAYAAAEYYMLNKPAGVLSATEDPNRRTVVDLIETALRGDLFPVGRLDLDTEGLLLITNDGALAHDLLTPKKHVDKVYEAQVEGALDPEIHEKFRAGMTLSDGTKVMPAELEILDQSLEGGMVRTHAKLTIHEGKFHQVKRMFEAAGGQVTHLKRLSMGPLTLDENLKPGQYRPLTEAEKEALFTLND